jgi:hypothetical protein
MTNSQPRAPRPSAIRRRPQSAQSVDEFIHAGSEGDPAIVEATPVTPVSETPKLEEKLLSSQPDVSPPDSPPPKEGGKTSFALFLGACALGVSLFNLYHSSWGVPVREILGIHSEAITETTPALAQDIVEPLSTTFETPSVPAAEAEALNPEKPITGIQGVQWLALTDLQFARHDLLLGLNTSARESLILAKVHLSLLGESFAAEIMALDRIISKVEKSSVLSLGQLDRDIELLKLTWLREVFGSLPQDDEGLLSWLNPWSDSTRQPGHTELETTDEGRYLVARLDRLKWLALWGDEAGFRQASGTVESFLGSGFLDTDKAKPWLYWLRGLQRIPLRHDVTELTTLIVRLSRLELSR